MIESALVHDAEEILALQKLAYQSEAELYNDYSIPPLTQTKDAIKREFATHHFLKFVVEGEIVGSVRAIAQDGTTYIGRLIVHPDFQGRGIGTTLMTAIEQHFAASSRFELFTGDRSERNLRLYEKLGYREFKRDSLTPDVTIVFLEKLVY